jgi:NADH:ubiquinone reductase (non-electrogenic)
LTQSFPEVADRVKISLVEALPRILPMFDSKLIEYTEQKLNATRKVKVWTKRAVTKVDPTTITIKNMDSGELQAVPYGTLVWVTGNSPVSLTKDLVQKLGATHQPVPRGLTVDEHLRVKGAKNIFALGDCALAGRLPPTAQVASQEGRFLGRLLNKFADDLHSENLANKQLPASDRPSSQVLDKNLDDSNKFAFNYLGTMAYIGDNEAIADFGPDSGKHAGFSTWLLWRSVYMSKLLSVRNRFLVASDWLRASVFGRDISRG